MQKKSFAPYRLAAALLLLCAIPSAQPRTKYNFTPGWLVTVGDPANAQAPTGPPIDQRQSTGTAEITGKYDGAGVTPVTHDNKFTLNVIEAEIYQSISPTHQP